MLKILWKMGEIAPEEQFLPLSTIFYYLMLDFYVKTGIRFSLRDKRLFEITEVEITRVDCIACASDRVTYMYKLFQRCMCPLICNTQTNINVAYALQYLMQKQNPSCICLNTNRVKVARVFQNVGLINNISNNKNVS